MNGKILNSSILRDYSEIHIRSELKRSPTNHKLEVNGESCKIGLDH